MTGKWKARMHTHKRVGDKLREFRLKNELTQGYLAKCIGCHPSSISSLELGKFGSMELMEGVLWALGLDLSDMRIGHASDLIPIQRGRPQPSRVAPAHLNPRVWTQPRRLTERIVDAGFHQTKGGRFA